jgi:hypothetical protein
MTCSAAAPVATASERVAGVAYHREAIAANGLPISSIAHADG